MPDQTMRERVAKALYLEGVEAEDMQIVWDDPDLICEEIEGWGRYADAALTALATPTPAMVEAGAKALFEESQGLDQDNSWDDPLPDEWRAAWHEAAEAVITAALTAVWEVRG